MKVKFLKAGNVRWVSKSGKTEYPVYVSPGTVFDRVRIAKSDTKSCYDLKEGNWTIYGVSKKFIQIMA